MPWTNPRREQAVKGASANHGLPAHVDGESSAAVDRWHKLSRRLFLFSTNALATLLVVVAAVAFCRQVVRWWYEPAPPQPVVPTGSTGGLPGSLRDPSLSQTAGHPELPDDPREAETAGEIFLGPSPWAWSRREIRGSGEEVVRELVRLTASCMAMLSEPFTSGPTQANLPILDERFFGDNEAVWEIVPVTAGAEVWLLPAAVPVTMGVSRLNGQQIDEGPSLPNTQAGAETSSGEIDSRSRPRIAAFGMAQPVGEDRWQLDVFWYCGGSPNGQLPNPEIAPSQPSSAGRSFGAGEETSTHTQSERFGAVAGNFARLLPDGASPVFGFSTALLGFQMVFRGPGPVEAWTQHFERVLTAEGWSGQSGWMRHGRTIRRAFTRVDPLGHSRLEIAIFPSESGDYMGMIFEQPTRFP